MKHGPQEDTPNLPWALTGPYCDIEMSHPIPKVNDYNMVAPVYDEVFGEEFARTMGPLIEQKVRRHLGRKRPRALLDIGCGGGAMLRYLSAVLGCRCTGVDVSAEQIRQARRAARAGEPPIKFEVCDIANYKVREEVDVVIMTFDVINHLCARKLMRQALDQSWRALALGGLLIFDMITPGRLEMDMYIPEVIVRPGITALQCGIGLRRHRTGVRRRLWVQVLDYRSRKLKVHELQVEHLAVDTDAMVRMLRETGMDVLETRNCQDLVSGLGPYMTHRVLMVARKPCGPVAGGANVRVDG